MKKRIFLFALFFVVSVVYAETIIISREELKGYLNSSQNWKAYTPDELCRYYKSNELRFENDFYHKIFKVKGIITKIRRSFLDEYVVELKCTEDWFSDLAIVYPKQISEIMKKELMTLEIGQAYEAVVIGRKTWYWVDVPVWNQNGVYRTEP